MKFSLEHFKEQVKKYRSEATGSRQRNLTLRRDWTLVLIVAAILIVVSIGYGLKLFLLVSQAGGNVEDAPMVAINNSIDQEALAETLAELNTRDEYHAQILDRLPPLTSVVVTESGTTSTESVSDEETSSVDPSSGE